MAKAKPAGRIGWLVALASLAASMPAGAVVTKPLPPYVVAAGVPAKVVRERKKTE